MALVDIVIDCSHCKPAERTASIAALDGVMKAGSILAANVASPDIEKAGASYAGPAAWSACVSLIPLKKCG